MSVNLVTNLITLLLFSRSRVHEVSGSRSIDGPGCTDKRFRICSAFEWSLGHARRTILGLVTTFLLLRTHGITPTTHNEVLFMVHGYLQPPSTRNEGNQDRIIYF